MNIVKDGADPPLTTIYSQKNYCAHVCKILMRPLGKGKANNLTTPAQLFFTERPGWDLNSPHILV